MKRLVIIATDAFAEYEAKGLERLEAYYNPCHVFDEVYALSPFEPTNRVAYGVHIERTNRSMFQRRLVELRPDAVRAYCGYWQADLACRHRIPGIPVLVSQHDAPPHYPHRSIRYADMVICMSRIVANTATRRGVPQSRIRMLPNRVDLSVFHRSADENGMAELSRKYPGKYRVLHIGRKTPQKNLDTVIKALVHLPADYVCLCVGLGKSEPYRRLARHMGVDNRLFWVDSVPNSQLPLWYSWCDCFCTPSRYEGFGVVFIEAAACAAAIVTSNVAPMNEYLEHDVTAHLVERYTDPLALAKAISTVCENRDYRLRLGTNASQMARRFSALQVDSAEADLYREAMLLPLRPPSPFETAFLAMVETYHHHTSNIIRRFWQVARDLKHACLATSAQG